MKKDIGDIDTLINLLKKSIDVRYITNKITDPIIKKLLVKETDVAIQKGVFGVPTTIIDDNLFWGNDQIEHIELLLAGRDPLDKPKNNRKTKRN